MQNNKVSTSTTEGQTRPDFITIDDAIQKAEAVVSDLKKLGERKYPLDVRKASRNTNRNESGKEVKRMVGGYKSNRDSIQVRDGKRTYFIDVEKTAEGKPYLRITESRFKGEGSERERSSIVIFQEKAEEFAEAVAKQSEKVNQK